MVIARPSQPATDVQFPDARLGTYTRRPGRALIGWMQTDIAVRLLNGNDASASMSNAHISMVNKAQVAVATRAAGVDQVGILSPATGDLAGHIAQLRQFGPAQAMFSEGWEVALANLLRVCAFQPVVFVDSARDRVNTVDFLDLQSLARMSLPLTAPAQLPVQFDQVRNTFAILSQNPNLRIASTYSGPAANSGGVQVLGFTVGMAPSFMQVVEFQGRYFLRDGYHRALGLLSAGVQQVPVFFRHIRLVEELFPAGMLPQGAFLGDRPPILPDYSSNLVSADVELPALQKLVAIQGLELNVH